MDGWERIDFENAEFRALCRNYLHLLREKGLETRDFGATYRISHDMGVTFGDIQKSPITSPHGPVAYGDGLLWVGRTITKDDDKANECFRRYAKASDSYEDHSLFLLRKRYESLFALPIGDYKAWAHGLKACGYATDPKYPEKLIRLIELYNLQDLTLDKDLKAAGFVKDSDTTWTNTPDAEDAIQQAAQGGINDYVYPPMEDLMLYEDHAAGYRNGVRYIIAGQGETYASLAYFLNIREKTLRKYNDALDTRELEPGDMVYVYPKKNRTSRKYTYYYFKPGDTAWEIAQKYGIKLKSLYKLNGIPYGTELKTQQRLRLR